MQPPLTSSEIKAIEVLQDIAKKSRIPDPDFLCNDAYSNKKLVKKINTRIKRKIQKKSC